MLFVSAAKAFPDPAHPGKFHRRAVRWIAFATGILCVGAVRDYGQTLVWRERAPVSRARAGYMAGVIEGKYVIAGGSDWVNHQKQWTDEVDIFDPLGNAWAAGTRLPEPRSDAASVVFDNALYVFGGGQHDEVRRDALVFRRGTWHALPAGELPEPRVYSVAVADRGLIYLVGGMSDHTKWDSLSNQLWVWNPHSPNTGWRKLAPIPGPGLITEAVAAVRGKIYVLGGAKTGGKDVVNVKTAYEYDVRGNRWTVLPDLPIERRCWWGMPFGNEMLLFGGVTTTYESDVFAYRPSTKELTRISRMPHGLCDAKFFPIGNSIYGMGGESGSEIRGPWTLEATMPRNGTKRHE